MRQLTPILQYLALYKPELTAIFANSVAATQARLNGVHYLRTTNPFNAENLAVYPRRVGTNRTNPYNRSRSFLKLQQGMPVFDGRHCGAGNPLPTNVPLPPLPPAVGEILIPDQLLSNILAFAFAGAGRNAPAPPCRQQGPITFGGETTQYPHVNER